jgi:ABC-type Mn2+/Zn2+ transport system ATPase subunit
LSAFDAAPVLALADFHAGYSAAEPVVEHVDLVLRRGTLTALVGPNGAGKTTLLKGMLGLTPVADPARVGFFGCPLDAARDRVAYLPQRSEIDWNFPLCALDVACMGVYRRVGLFRRLGRDARARAERALDLVGLAAAARTPIGELSGGQRQRLLVARALAQDAQLLLLDEPFANVDERSERTIAEVLQRLRGEGCTILAVHHDLATVRAYFDEVVVFNRRVIAHGPAADTLSEATVARVFGLASVASEARA